MNKLESKTEIPESSGSMQQQQNQQKKKSGAGKVFLYVGIAFVAFIVIVIGIVFFATRGVSDAANLFIGSLQTSQCDQIYTEQVTPRFQSFGTQEQWADECERISQILTGDVNQQGVEVSSESGEASTGTASYQIEGSDGVTYTILLELVKVDGEWKVDTFTSEGQGGVDGPTTDE